jgi:hypothetical protein
MIDVHTHCRLRHRPAIRRETVGWLIDGALHSALGLAV